MTKRQFGNIKEGDTLVITDKAYQKDVFGYNHIQHIRDRMPANTTATAITKARKEDGQWYVFMQPDGEDPNGDMPPIQLWDTFHHMFEKKKKKNPKKQ